MAPFLRIALRYLSGVLVGAGYLMPEDTALFSDPDLVASLVTAVGAVAGVIAEVWYWAARKFGWSK